MKRSFLTLLPIMAALLLVASCSKDDDTNTVTNNEQTNAEPAPVEVVAQPEYVKIPFSVKVDNGAKLSKISYSGSDASITRAFEDSEAGNLAMSVTGDGIESGSTLTLKKEGDNFIFEGEISVESGKEEAFTTTGIDLTGTFGTALTAAATSTISLIDLMQTCNHEYKATFQSNTTDAIVIYDQNAYFCFSLAETQTKFQLTIGSGEPQDFTPDATSHKIWIAVAGGTTVKGNLVSTSGLTTVASKIYNANRTDVVDLGPTFSVLWKTTNETGGTVSSSYSQPDAETSVYKDEKYYNWADACAFGRINESDEYEKGTADPFRLPTKAELEALGSGTWKTKNSVNGREFSTDYGSVFFPAAGLDGGDYAGNEGYCWSGESYDDNGAYLLGFYDGYAYVSPGGVYFECSVRLVRGL